MCIRDRAVSSIPTFSRVVRGAVITARDADYVEAARAIGAKDATIIFHEVLPNSLAPVSYTHLDVYKRQAIYRSVYYFLQNDSALATKNLLETIQIAGAIAMGIFTMDSLFRLVLAYDRKKAEKG